MTPSHFVSHNVLGLIGRHHRELAVSMGEDFKPRRLNTDPNTAQMLRLDCPATALQATSTTKGPKKQASPGPLGRHHHAENMTVAMGPQRKGGKRPEISTSDKEQHPVANNSKGERNPREAREGTIGTSSALPSNRKRRVSGYGWST